MASANLSLYFEWFRSDWMTSFKYERFSIVCLGLKVVEDFRDGVEPVLRLLRTASQVRK
jgi:hypothetical protein